MNEIIICSQCKSQGRTNKCFITGYNSKCGHDVGWAYGRNKNGSQIMVCNCCSGKNNQCYITGYDYKCGHDNGWAYVPSIATCNSCGKTLSGKWTMENNPQNNSYFNTTTGRYLGINDGYFLYGGNPNWVYSYCKPCWIKEIQKILPMLGLKQGDAQQKNATCNSCGKTLSGKWIMESNPSNISYFNTTTGRYLGISDGYFLYGGSPNQVYSYCKPCWIKEIQKILPSLGISNSDLLNKLKSLENELQNKKNECIESKKEIDKKNNIIQNLENEINKLKEIKKKEEPQNNLVSAPVTLTPNNFGNIFDKNFNQLEIEKIKNLLKSSQIDEISNLDNLLSFNDAYFKLMNEFKNNCQMEIKNQIKTIIEKIDIQIEKINTNINNISSVLEEIKEKLSSDKRIPENVSNESIIPLKKYLEEQTKKVDKI